MRPVIATVLALTAAVPVSGQSPAPDGPPAVFLDCSARGCDSQHFRNEIRFVNWVRDRTVADVYVLVTSLETGGGGESYRVTFDGMQRFEGDSTEIQFATDRDMTEAEERDLLTERLAQGLVRYAVQTNAASLVRVTSSDADPDVAEEPVIGRQDPWNFWVFSTSLNAELDGESREQSREFQLSLNAERITESLKVELRLEGTYDEQEFELTDRTVTSVRKDYEASSEVAFAVGGQWSTGLRLDFGTSSFANQDLYARTAALVEYSFFPYEDFSRRRVTLQYSVGARYFDYEQLTIYDRMTEQRADHQLAFQVEFQQQWGEASVELSGSHFLDNVRRNNLSTRANLNIRLIRGLSLDVNGNYERVRDQIYIPKGDASDEEVLLQRRALETGYRYGMRVGLRYSFGSIYNNIVNPRLADGGDDFDFRI